MRGCIPAPTRSTTNRGDPAISTATAYRKSANGSYLLPYFEEIERTAQRLSSAEEGELSLRVAEGDPHARARLAEANLLLVVHLARRYVGRGLALEDLIEEGNLGLMRAVEAFDGSRGVRFSTYAALWIKQTMRRALMNECRPIRLPVYLVTLLSKVRAATARLSGDLGRDPTAGEIGRVLGLTEKRSGIVERAAWVHGLRPQAEGRDGEAWSIDEVLVDDRSRPATEALADREEIERALAGLREIDPREAQVIRMRFGLGPYAAMTLQAAGEVLGLTRERVRQLEKQGLTKILDAMGGEAD
jgi:RNA polymerase primary sigma factor